jgi:signal transduction histidine kinase
VQGAAAVVSGQLEGLGGAVEIGVAAYALVVFAVSRQSALLGGAVLVVGNAVRDVSDPTLRTAFDYGFSWFLQLAAVGLGVSVRAVRARAVSAEQRAELAERERDLRAREAVVAERERIARELHDVVAHSVSVMVLQAGAVRRTLAPTQDEQAQALRAVADTGRQAMTEMRRLVALLREPPGLPAAPGLDAVPGLVEDARRLGLDVALRETGDPLPVSPVLGATAYRVVQEGLTNVRKHARASAAEVSVHWGETHLEVEVTDDGVGVPAGSSSTGYGLVGMAERAVLLGGTVTTATPDDGGFQVRAVLPLAGPTSRNGPP